MAQQRLVIRQAMDLTDRLQDEGGILRETFRPDDNRPDKLNAAERLVTVCQGLVRLRRGRERVGNTIVRLQRERPPAEEDRHCGECEADRNPVPDNCVDDPGGPMQSLADEVMFVALMNIAGQSRGREQGNERDHRDKRDEHADAAVPAEVLHIAGVGQHQ